jgi:uncharacterized protein
MSAEILLLAGLFLLAAVIYSMAGFGGGTAYIAMLALSGVPITHVAVVALLCNVIVVAGGTWRFAGAGHLRPTLLLPFLITSAPSAYIGGRLALEAPTLHLLTGAVLLLAGLALLLSARRASDLPEELPTGFAFWSLAAVLGLLLGMLAGVIGIGGGVFLAPILHLLRWGTARQIAATASAFILINSLAGLAGKAAHVADAELLLTYAPLFVAVLLGGQLGSHLGARRLPASALRRITALVVLYAALNLLMR